MRLILQDYFRNLKERDELDLILPDLLTSMGMRVFLYPQKGTKQYGVDLAAYSEDIDGNLIVNLFTIKQGDLDNKTWNADKNSVRQSLDEILDAFINTRLSEKDRERDIIIHCVIGGSLLDTVSTHYHGYTKNEETDKLKFELWDSGKLAQLANDYFFNERLLVTPNRVYLNKGLSMIDEPSICAKYFKKFVLSSFELIDKKPSTIPHITSAIRLAYSIIVSWAKDADNYQSARLCGEIAILFCWDQIRKVTNKKSIFKKSQCYLDSIILQYLSTNDEFLDKKIIPLVDKPLAISSLVQSYLYLDVNLKLFDLLGQIALQGVWYIYLLNSNPTDNDQIIIGRMDLLASTIVRLISNNPCLYTPITDAQTIEISMAIFFLKYIPGMKENIHNWLIDVQNLQEFALGSNNIFTTCRSQYADLLSYHFDPSKFNRKDDTLSASSLQAHMLLWSQLFDDEELEMRTKKLIDTYYSDSNLQIWLPDEHTEDCIYINKENTGIAYDQIKSGDDVSGILLKLLQEEDLMQRFSADDFGYWPILLTASMYHRIPIYPGFHYIPLD